jgi:peroxiredoxin
MSSEERPGGGFVFLTSDTGLIQRPAKRPDMTNVGDKAPDFALYDYDRKVRKLSEFLTKGRKTILAFFPGAFTGVCDKEMCTFRDMYGELEKLNGVVVGVSVDAPFAQKAFAEKFGLKFPLLCDFKREVIKMYDVAWKNLGGVEDYVTANRAIFVVDDSGKVQYKWLAESPGVLPDFEAIKRAL